MPSQSAIWFETTTKRFGGWQDCVQHLSRSRHLAQIGGQRTGTDGNRREPACLARPEPGIAVGSTGNDRETTGTDGARPTPPSCRKAT